MKEYLQSTYFIDSDHPAIIEFAARNSQPGADDIETAISLYYAVRDSIRYNPYTIEPGQEAMKASHILEKEEGYCVAKAVLLAACARSRRIPSRLGFADVKNHLNTKRLKQLMGTDIFVYHGYTEMFLADKWLKATPAFNLTLCQHFNIQPLEFDGRNDSIFHPFDQSGKKHMEYIKDHGTFADLPWERLLTAMMKAYPLYFEKIGNLSGDFSKEAVAENQ